MLKSARFSCVTVGLLRIPSFLGITLLVSVLSFNSVQAAVFAPHDCGELYSPNFVSEMHDQIDSRIAGLETSVGHINIFSSRGNGGGGWSRNASVWTKNGDFPLDLTGVSPWNSYGGYTRAGTLISPKHIVYANHFQYPIGTTIVFIDSAGAVVSRTVQAKAYIQNSDIIVGVLNEAVPNTVAFYPIMSGDEINHYFDTTTGMPLVVLDQEGKAIVRNVVLIGHPQLKRTLHQVATSLPRSLFSEELVDGDSGNPGFLVAGDQLILNFTHKGPSHGIAHGNFINEINSAMTTLGSSGYQVSTFDLSCFTSGQIVLIPQTFFISERAAKGLVVGSVYAKGLFLNHQPYYSIISGDSEGAFSISSSTGAISVLNPSLLNFKTKPQYVLTVQVSSIQNPYNLSTTTITINVMNVSSHTAVLH